MSNNRKWSPRQLEIISKIDTGGRYHLIVGGSGSGKTSIGIRAFLNEVTKYRGCTFAIIAMTENQVQVRLLPEINRIINEYGINAKFKKVTAKEYHWLSNKILVFSGYNVKSATAIQGIDVAGMYIDEVINIPEEVTRECFQRVRQVDYPKVIMSCNPKGRRHWFYEAYLADNSIMEQHGLQLRDNPSLSDDFIKSMEVTNVGAEYKRRVEGIWANPDGQCYPYYLTGEPTVPLHRYVLSVDPADASITHGLLVARQVDNKIDWIIDEWRWDAVRTGKPLTHIEQCKRMRKHFNKVDYVIVDEANQAFRRQLGNTFNVPTYNSKKGRIIESVNDTAGVLNSGRLRISHTNSMSNAPILEQEIRDYVWNPVTDKPIKEYDHACDAMRYYVTGGMSVPVRRISNYAG